MMWCAACGTCCKSSAGPNRGFSWAPQPCLQSVQWGQWELGGPLEERRALTTLFAHGPNCPRVRLSQWPGRELSASWQLNIVVDLCTGYGGRAEQRTVSQLPVVCTLGKVHGSRLEIRAGRCECGILPDAVVAHCMRRAWYGSAPTPLREEAAPGRRACAGLPT